MALPTYDIGIHSEHIEAFLSTYNTVKIIGFSRSGKSTLAEILTEEFKEKQKTVLHQNALTWLVGLPTTGLLTDAVSIDSELTEAITHLEKYKKPYWIIDDAEIMMAFASEQILNIISTKIQQGIFNIIFIRNRFINEYSGWFHNREDLVDNNIPQLLLRPLKPSSAIDVAKKYYEGNQFADHKASWLAEVSGGVPGLMSELLPFAPDYPNPDIENLLKLRVRERYRHLKLNEFPRNIIIKALISNILPPPLLLSDNGQAELAALQICGMVRIDYAWEEEPFHGTFWMFAIDENNLTLEIPARIIDTAFNLSILLEENGLLPSFLVSLDMEGKSSLDLAKAFSGCLFCEENKELSEFVKPLNKVLSEHIGAIQMHSILKKIGINTTTNLKGIDLGNLILKSTKQ